MIPLLVESDKTKSLFLLNIFTPLDILKYLWYSVYNRKRLSMRDLSTLAKLLVKDIHVVHRNQSMQCLMLRIENYPSNMERYV